MQQLWHKITTDTVEEQPYAQWLEEGRWEKTHLPQADIVGKMAQLARKRADEADKEADKARRKVAQGKMQEDMRNGGAAAHKAVKGALGAKKEYV